MSDAEPLKAEIIRCGKDPHYFINKYVRIQHPVRGLIPFKMFDYQETLIDDYVRERFNVILKSRQIGISEVTASFIAWLMLFHRNKNVLVMATKADTAKNIVKKVRIAIKKLPFWLQISRITADNKLSLELENGSQVKAIASSDDAGRSEALSLLVIDEAAFVKNLEELWTGLIPTVSAGGKIIVLSTPNGTGNLFHKLFTDAMTGLNEFFHTKLMWWVHPERISDLTDDPDRPGFKTSSWYRAELKKTNMSPRQVAQELECNFNASGETFLDPQYIDQVEAGCIEPQQKAHWDRGLHYWWMPEKGKRYAIFCDVARGDGRDNSSAMVYNIDTMDECAEYYGKIPVEEFARLLVDLGHEYNTAMLSVENNNIGMACLEHVRLAQYENVYYSTKGNDKPGEAVHSAWGPSTTDRVIGFTMSQKVRPLVFAKLEEFLRNRAITIRSKRWVVEARTFIWENGKPQAEKGYNDDLMSAAAQACWLRDTFLMPGEMAANLDKALLGAMKMSSHLNTEIKGASKDPSFVQQATMGIFTSNNPVPTQIRLPGNRVIDFKWLYGNKR
jgi:hypothetical protein